MPQALSRLKASARLLWKRTKLPFSRLEAEEWNVGEYAVQGRQIGLFCNFAQSSCDSAKKPLQSGLDVAVRPMIPDVDASTRHGPGLGPGARSVNSLPGLVRGDEPDAVISGLRRILCGLPAHVACIVNSGHRLSPGHTGSRVTGGTRWQLVVYDWLIRQTSWRRRVPPSARSQAFFA